MIMLTYEELWGRIKDRQEEMLEGFLVVKVSQEEYDSIWNQYTLRHELIPWKEELATKGYDNIIFLDRICTVGGEGIDLTEEEKTEIRQIEAIATEFLL